MLNQPIFVPSTQQADFLGWCQHGDGSCVLEAVAGSGKTTTLLQAAKIIPGGVAIMAYNKKIADEIKIKLNNMGIDWKKAQAGTCHSFGLKAYKKAFPMFNIDRDIRGSKVDDIAEIMFPDGSDYASIRPRLCQLVSLAKQTGIGFLRDFNSHDAWIELIEHHDIDLGDGLLSDQVEAAKALLSHSNENLAIIDYDDMIYLPLLLRLKFWQYDVVMLDEAQDTNAARRELARRMLNPRHGRMIAVGDRAQAIYGFTGADNDSLDLIRKEFKCIDMPMTKTFRCPTSVVAFARNWVSHIEAVDTAPVGSVTQVMSEDFMNGASADAELATSAILCRNTKPLVSMALALIRRKVACKVEGRDVGANLKKLATRWKVRSAAILSEKLVDHLHKQTIKLTARKRLAQVQVLEDTVETIQTIIDQCKLENKVTVDDVVNYIDTLFADNVSGMLVLSTIHKSKGREWNRVFWLDRANLCPSRYAKQEWEKVQEANLCYVAATRAQRDLIEIIV